MTTQEPRAGELAGSVIRTAEEPISGRSVEYQDGFSLESRIPICDNARSVKDWQAVYFSVIAVIGSFCNES
jgi:hypothetical protein